MPLEEDDMWMENLEEFVFEDRRAVTYKWLSRALSVHVNVAKQMLFSFSQKNKDKVQLVYLLAGNQGQTILVKLVKDVDLEKAESAFDSLTSKHIHTVAAKEDVTQLLSEANILNIDIKTRKEFKPTTAFSGIVNKRATPRASKQTPEVKVKEEKKPEVIKPKAEMTKPKSGLEQMFGKQKEKGSASQTSEKSSSSQASTSSATAKMSKPASTAAKKSKDIAGMFAKQAAAGPVIKKEIKKEETSPGKENRLNQEKEENLMREKEKEASKKETSKKRPSKGAAAGNLSKKRKRIQVLSDSESSEDEGTQESEHINDSPPPPQAVLIDSEDEDVIQATPQASRGRVMKMKKKTYEDEDGFMVTKMEMASCSEDSDNDKKTDTKSTKISPKKGGGGDDAAAAKKPVPAPSANSAGKVKQASIMNFFTKK